MCSVVAFFRGKRRLTNGMLDDLRAAGFYAGKGFALGWKPKKDFDGFATETAAIRQMVALRFKQGKCWCDPWSAAVAVVYVVGHYKQDPDSWMLLGKAALDGLVDSGAVARDRRGVTLEGETSIEYGQLSRYLPVLKRFADDGQAGFWLWLGPHSSAGVCMCDEVHELRGGS